MDADTRHKLIAHILGDLDRDEGAALERELDDNAGLREEHTRLQRQVRVMRLLPEDDAPDEVVNRLVAKVAGGNLEESTAGHTPDDASNDTEAPVIPMPRLTAASFARVAALFVIAFLFGLAVYVTPTGPEETIAEVTDDSGLVTHVKGAELVEARMGTPRTLRFAAGEVHLDGGSAVSLITEEDSVAPRVMVDRGRVIVSAKAKALRINVAGNDVELDRGGVLAIDYDVAFANLASDGSFVEVQRMPIHEVARLALDTYGIELNAGALPENVRNFRVTFYGNNLDEREFVESFVDSAARFGVRLDSDGRHLKYEPRSGRIESSNPWALDIAVLEGNAHVRGEAGDVRLAGESGMPNYVSLTPADPGARDIKSLNGDEMDRAVVWATGFGEGYTRTEISSEPLPRRAVIHTDKLVLRGDQGNRIFVLDGPEFDFPLPGGRMGRLVQTTASGAEFEVKEQDQRVWVPFSQLADRNRD